jgi:UDP-GlcNAc:undecaprenyl-phosphate/decaprenyl-phosphate GlcNAc-1-phosphate transferase
MKPACNAITFLLPSALTLILTPLVIWISYRRKILDYPKDNSIHEKPVPMLGGAVIFVVFFSVSLFLKHSDGLAPLFFASLPIIISGIYDDLKGIKATGKLLIQSLSGLILISFGITVAKVEIPFGPVIELGIFSIPVTIIWFIVMTNLINIVDGLDGLAAGLSSIIFLVLMSFMWPSTVSAQILVILGATAAFLIFNFHPARIFLGNNGSTFLGFAIAYFALVTSQKSTIAPILLLPCVILLIHVIDIAYAIARRTSEKMSIFKGDRKHLHHIMLNMIGNHTRTVLIFYLISLSLAVAMTCLTR